MHIFVEYDLMFKISETWNVIQIWWIYMAVGICCQLCVLGGGFGYFFAEIILVF